MAANFSGHFVLDRPACTLRHPASAVQQAVLDIDHAEPVFKTRAKFIAPSSKTEIRMQRWTDGREIEYGDNEIVRMYWDGDALVGEQRSSTWPVVTETWRYELLEDGRRLRATERVQGGGRDQDNVWEFVRQ